MLTANVRAWEAAGAYEEVLGRRLFFHRGYGGGPLIVLLHGLPSSSFDWRGLLDHLPGRRVLAADLLGFGLSEKPPDHLCTLAWQADAITELARRPPGHPGGAALQRQHRRRARLSGEWFFRHEFGALFSPGHPLSAEEAADQWALFEHLGDVRIAHRLIHNLGERTTFADRRHGAVL